jgi:hypothetical protein
MLRTKSTNQGGKRKIFIFPETKRKGGGSAIKGQITITCDMCYGSCGYWQN